MPVALSTGEPHLIADGGGAWHGQCTLAAGRTLTDTGPVGKDPNH